MRQSSRTNPARRRLGTRTCEGEKLSKKLEAFAALSVAVALTLGAYVFVATGIQAEYAENLDAVSRAMQEGAVEAKALGNETTYVWYSTLQEEGVDDQPGEAYLYSTADSCEQLTLLYDAPETQRAVESIELHNAEVDELMEDLQKPPHGYREAYETTLDMYAEYTTLTALAINPSGTYASYSEQLAEAGSNMNVYCKRLQSQIPKH